MWLARYGRQRKSWFYVRHIGDSILDDSIYLSSVWLAASVIASVLRAVGPVYDRVFTGVSLTDNIR